MTENYEQEKSIYIRKLTSQIETIDKILNTNTLDLISGEMDTKLRELKQAAERYKQKLEKNEFEIAIVGLEKAGKSTFANAMMGNDILPSDDAQCTFTSTKICAGNDTATVTLFSHSEFNERFVKKLETMGIEKAASYNFETLDLSSYQRMFERLDEKTKREYENDINEDVKRILSFKSTIHDNLGKGSLSFSGKEQLTSEEFKRYIKTPAYALAVKEIEIKSSQMQDMSNAVIYDVPGFDSTTREHPEQTIKFMKEADAIVLVASAYKPTFTKPVADMFKNYTDSDGVSFSEKMFVFANRADNATDLNKNIGKIKEELRKYNLLQESNFHRLIPGSALAYLEKKGAIKSNMTNGYAEDGIAQIRKVLKAYNETERFTILKRRINQKQDEIYDVFKELFKENNVSASTNTFQCYGKLLNDVTDKRKQIITDLEAYRDDLREEYNSKKEISEEVKEKVVCGITSTNFAVTEEEKKWAKNKASRQVRPIPLTTKIDEILREKKREDIYSKFSEGILEIADVHHKKFDAEVFKIFANNLGVAPTSQAAEVLGAFLKGQKHSFDGQGYYQSLIDRFSIDLFNILIDIPFADMKRFKRFEDEFEIFSSLAMFDDRKSRTNSGNSQPLYYSILFHLNDRYDKNEIINDILDTIKKVLDFVPAPPVVKLVESIVFAGDKPKIDKIKDLVTACSKMGKDLPKEKKEDNLLNKLKPIAGNNAAFDSNITKESYEKFFTGKRDKTPEDVISEIESDIDILHDALNGVVIKAINIETAFLALEVRNIDQLTACLNGTVWSDFINNNIQVINAAEYNDLDAERKRQESRQNILKDIKSLLDQMNNSSTTNTEN